MPVFWVSPRGGVLANFRQQAPGTRLSPSLRTAESGHGRVRRAMGRHAITRGQLAAASTASRDAVAVPEDRRANARTGDLVQTSSPTLPTSWRKPRVGTQMPLYHEKYLQVHHSTARTR